MEILSNKKFFEANEIQKQAHRSLMTLLENDDIGETSQNEYITALLGLLSKKISSKDFKPLHPEVEKNNNINTGIPETGYISDFNQSNCPSLKKL